MNLHADAEIWIALTLKPMHLSLANIGVTRAGRGTGVEIQLGVGGMMTTDRDVTEDQKALAGGISYYPPPQFPFSLSQKPP